jgi:NAD(P)H-hydrate epimerase
MKKEFDSVVTIAQMKEIDKLTIEELGINVLVLMENAGRISARFAVDKFNPRKVCVLVGPGHNGGDGLVAARYLHNLGVSVEVVLAKKGMKEINMKQLCIIKKIGIPVVNAIPDCDLIMDCLLGYSARGDPMGGVLELVEQVNKLEVPVLSIDMPTKGIRESVVLTIGLPKEGLEGVDDLYVCDIGFPKLVLERLGVKPIDFKGKEYVKLS